MRVLTRAQTWALVVGVVVALVLAGLLFALVLGRPASTFAVAVARSG